MKKKRKLSLTWSLLATAAIFFIFGRFVAPVYESHLLESGLLEEVYPVSTISIYFAGFLIFMFVIALVLRFIRRKG